MKQKGKYHPLRIVAITMGSISLFFCFYNVYILTSSSFPTAGSDLYRIDSLASQDRTYLYKKRGINITTTDGFKFDLKQAHYYGIAHQKRLLDTLNYYGTIFSIYTNKEGFEDYHAGRTENSIDIYRFIIGDKEYTNLAISNERIVIKQYIECISGLILAFVFIYCGTKKNL